VARLFYAVSLVPRVLLLVLMVAILVDMMLGVFFRYIVGQALPWTEEVGTLTLVWLTFIGGAIGVGQGSHFAIHLLLDHLGPTGQRAVRVLTGLLVLVVGGLLVVFGWRLMLSNSTSQTPALGLNLGVLYASSVVGGVLMICYALALMIGAWRGRAMPGLGGTGSTFEGAVPKDV
jgi:TRAP-type C4-dicarboxylate transport system permease small subunit